MNPFTKHPRQNGMGYWQHLAFAWTLSTKLAYGATACLIHGLMPFWLKNAATGTVTSVISKLSKRYKPQDVELFILDVDGTLTDGQVLYPSKQVNFSPRDGHGLKRLQAAGVELAIVTGRPYSDAVQERAEDLGIRHQYFGISDKSEALLDLLETTGIPYSRMVCMGDDINDLPIMDKVSLSFAPADAHPEVLQAASIVTNNKAGDGAAREAADIIFEMVTNARNLENKA